MTQTRASEAGSRQQAAAVSRALQRLLIGSLWLWSFLFYLWSGFLQVQAVRADDATLSTSPAAGPANALITVNGSGWTQLPDGTPVTFGYSLQDCQPGDYTLSNTLQAATIQQGSFSGRLSIPVGSQTGTYKICAMLGALPMQAGSYTLLSSAAAAISVSPAKVTAGQQATATGSNFLPANTQVTLLLLPAGGSSITLGTVTADMQGHFSLTFTVPATLSGAAQVQAEAGGSPPAISASFPLVIAAPSTAPPRASATPTATPRPTPRVTATATPTKTPVRPAATVQQGGITPATATAATTATATSTGTAASGGNFFASLLAPIAVVSISGLLLFGLCGGLLYRRHQRHTPPTAHLNEKASAEAAEEAPGSAALLETLMRQAQNGLQVLPGRSPERANEAPAPPQR